MKKLKTISQFESENELKGSELKSVKGGDIGRTSNLTHGTTAATTEGGDTDCSEHIVDDYGMTILLYIRF